MTIRRLMQFLCTDAMVAIYSYHMEEELYWGETKGIPENLLDELVNDIDLDPYSDYEVMNIELNEEF